MNRVDHWAEALRLRDEVKRADPDTFVFDDPVCKLLLAVLEATLATIPDSISGALDARSVIAERGDLL